MTSVDASILALRAVAAGFAVYNIWWTLPGARTLLKGSLSPPALYLAVVFWFSAAVIVFQCVWLSGRVPVWQLLAYSILAGSMALATIGHRLGMSLKARNFYRIYDHLDCGLAIIDYEVVDPEGAADLARECRRRTASILSKKASDGRA